ncbi:hypothetical protein DFJ73DRAFT_143879 [Zopfochytrium polystomum]|nr:hypothetical protein DFJ73DRAFT_143879 [Zopfochytrium polystomum]
MDMSREAGSPDKAEAATATTIGGGDSTLPQPPPHPTTSPTPPPPAAAAAAVDEPPAAIATAAAAANASAATESTSSSSASSSSSSSSWWWWSASSAGLVPPQPPPALLRSPISNTARVALAKMLAASRTIVHLDLDAFYAQVEQVRLGLAPDVPLAVMQWRGLLAVNYPSRKFGIKRFSTIEDAKKLCPDLVLVHVPTFGEGDVEPKYHSNPAKETHKASLDVYRAASKKVMAIFKRFFPRYQRASIDEAFIDVSDEVNRRILARLEDLQDALDGGGGGDCVEGDAECGDGGAAALEEPEVLWDGAGVLVGVEDASVVGPSKGWSDLQLRLGAEMAKEIRATVHKELGYTLSAGIAHNKTLAKICSGQNKPNNQSILRESEVLGFMETLKISKIRNLGGKLGHEIEEKLKVETAGDLRNIPLGVLKSKLGDATGVWAYNICRGICRAPVTQITQTKSFGSNKSIIPPARSMAEALRWLEYLVAEVYYRLMEEYDEYQRWPKTIVLSHRSPNLPNGGGSANLRNPYANPGQTKSCALPSWQKLNSIDVLRQLAMTMANDIVPFVPCLHLGLTVTGIASVESNFKFSLRDYFGARANCLPDVGGAGTSGDGVASLSELEAVPPAPAAAVDHDPFVLHDADGDGGGGLVEGFEGDDEVWGWEADDVVVHGDGVGDDGGGVDTDGGDGGGGGGSREDGGAAEKEAAVGRKQPEGKRTAQDAGFGHWGDDDDADCDGGGGADVEGVAAAAVMVMCSRCGEQVAERLMAEHNDFHVALELHNQAFREEPACGRARSPRNTTRQHRRRRAGRLQSTL